MNYNNKKRTQSSSISFSKGVFDGTKIPDGFIQVILIQTNTLLEVVLCSYLKKLPEIHLAICGCQNLVNCVTFYQRFRNNQGIVFHSLSYKKRNNSLSYMVKYGKLFGEIAVFMQCNGIEYAIINRLKEKHSFSSYFAASRYYCILNKPLDCFFYTLVKESNQIDVVKIEPSMKMCIAVEENDCFIVSPLSVHYEHD